MQRHPPSLSHEFILAGLLIPAFYLFYNGLIAQLLAIVDRGLFTSEILLQGSRFRDILRTELPFSLGVVNAWIIGRGLTRGSRFPYMAGIAIFLAVGLLGIYLILEARPRTLPLPSSSLPLPSSSSSSSPDHATPQSTPSDTP